MKQFLCRFLKSESGVGAVEYALIASLIAVAVITTVTLFGTNLVTTFGVVVHNLDGR